MPPTSARFGWVRFCSLLRELGRIERKKAEGRFGWGLDSVFVSLELKHNGPSHWVCRLDSIMVRDVNFWIEGLERTFETIGKMVLWWYYLISAIQCAEGRNRISRWLRVASIDA